MASRQRLKQNIVVTTVMANLGLDQTLEAAGIRVVKTQVGDRYVFEEMQRLGANLGGEQSGHLLFLDHAPAGDGILSALALLSVAVETGEPLASLGELSQQVSPGARERPGSVQAADRVHRRGRRRAGRPSSRR